VHTSGATLEITALIFYIKTHDFSLVKRPVGQ
jgi:hypothetical protein